MRKVNKILAKERHRHRLLEYLGDWENNFPKRVEMPDILGIKRTTLYKHFSPNELLEIENEGLELRKKNSGRQRAKVYESMVSEAKNGNTTAQKEFLDRTEGRVVEKRELTGKDGLPLLPTLTLEEVAQLHKIVPKK